MNIKSMLVAAAAALAALAATAQTTPQQKVSATLTRQVSTIDGTLSDLYRTTHRYDAQGREIEWVQYNLASGGGYNGGAFNLFDERGVQVGDSTSGTKWLYDYDGDGRICRKTKFTAGVDGTFAPAGSMTVKYDEAGRLWAEVNKTLAGEITDSTLYIYDGNGTLTNTDTYTRVSKTAYGVTRRTRYVYDAAGRVVRSLVKSVYNGSESVSKGNGYKYDELGRMVADTALVADADPRYLTKFQYEGSSMLSSGNEYYRMTDSGWYRSEVRTHTYATLSERRAPRLLSLEPAGDLGSVTVSVDLPADTEGYEGFRVVVDHHTVGSLHTGNSATIALSRGSHEVRVVSVYDGVEANASNALRTTIDLDLPTVTDIKVRTMEYKYSWTVTLGWTAPEAPGLHLRSYRVAYPTPWGYDDETSSKVTKATFAYSGKNVINVRVYAVYDEGTSDAAEFELDLTDTSNMVTEHWHNVAMTHTTADGVVGSEHYYYSDNDGNLSRPEEHAVTIAFDAEGKPLTRYVAEHMAGNYAKLLLEVRERWDADAHAWREHELVEYRYNDINQVGERVTYTYDAELEDYVVVATEESAYDDAVSATSPAETRYYTVDGDVKTLVQRKTYTHQIDAVGIQRIETATVYDADGVARQTVVTYRHATTGSEVHVDSVFTYDYVTRALVQREMVELDPESGLDAAYVTYDADGRVIDRKAYAASKEYHATHTATRLRYADGSLTWTAPSRTAGLDGYRLLVNDIAMATIEAGATSYSVALDLPSGRYVFALVPIYDGAEAAMSDGVEADYANTSAITAIVRPAAVSATYDLAGRRVSATAAPAIRIVGGQKRVLGF